MIGKKIEKALNEQINRELHSAYLYLGMSAQATALGLRGAGNWFYVQYQEETGHALKLYKYLLEQGASVELVAIEKPKAAFTTLLAMVEATLKHERFITQSINDLMDLAVSEKDYATQILLQWYVKEQVEEESNDTDLVTTLKMAGSSAGTLLMVDKQLGKRVFKAE